MTATPSKLDRMPMLLSLPPADYSDSQPPVPIHEELVAIEGLSFRYRGNERHTLQDINLRLEPGEFLLITGPSGCGKSSLALAIGGYLFHQFDGEATGNVTVGGLDVRAVPLFDVAEIVGLVQQNPEDQFCTLTVRDEVAFGLENRCLARDEIRNRLDWALGIVGALGQEGRDLASLSGGEKQKVAIAAMMATKPQVLIFDEPTSNLDPEATADIFGVIERIRAKAQIACIVIEHKVDYLRRFRPKHIAMDAGRIVLTETELNSVRPSLPREMHSESPSIAKHSSPEDEMKREARIHVEGLHAGYGDSSVLTDVTLCVHEGEFVSLMGSNGAGKTTLLECIMGLHAATSGQVVVMGMDTASVPVSKLAEDVGYVFQNPNHMLFSDTVLNEALFALRAFKTRSGRARREAALASGEVDYVTWLLDRAGLSDRIDDHPYRLSYGQKRRLNLVSVLAHKPKIVLLDEPFIGQDRANAEYLLSLLAEHTRGGGVVLLVNHSPGLVAGHASRVLFLDNGSIQVDAPPAEAFEQLVALGKPAYVP